MTRPVLPDTRCVAPHAGRRYLAALQEVSVTPCDREHSIRMRMGIMEIEM